MKIFLSSQLNFFLDLTYSQTEEDIILTKTIPNLLQNQTKEDYLKAIKLLLNLELKNGYLPEQKFKLLSSSYSHKDMVFFKKELLKLVENYGFDLILLDKRIVYYDAITTGEMSAWLRKKHP